MKTPAVFLDRDGTIIDDVGYLSDPERVRLRPDAAESIRQFQTAGCAVVLVSNQSGVARGLFDEAQLSAVHARLEDLLRDEGVQLDGAYYCPFLDGPQAIVERYRRESDMRKPRPGMLKRAARELQLDLTRSWMIGDSQTDVEAGRRAGCRTILLNGHGPHRNADRSSGIQADYTTEDLRGAVEIFKQSGATSQPDEIETVAEEPGRRTPPDLAALGASPILAPTAGDQANERQPPGSTPPAGDEVRWLKEIHASLERAQRSNQQHDFSVLRLFGALLQMTAVAAGAWGLVALLNDRVDQASARLLLACFLQLASVTALVTDRAR